MLAEPNHTQFDLHFRIFRIPVRVSPWFWLLGAIFGWRFVNDPAYGPGYLVLWILCVFVSILLHEIGHVVAGRWFGSEGHIVLFQLGGLAIGSNRLAKRWQRIVVSFAGPCAQFLLLLPIWWGTVYIINVVPAKLEYVILTTFEMLFFINLIWPLFNLLPVWPLDGGQISQEICEGLSPDRGLKISLGISGVVAGVLVVHSLMLEFKGQPLIPGLRYGSLYTALLFGILSVQSFQILNQLNRRDPWGDDRMPWE